MIEYMLEIFIAEEITCLHDFGYFWRSDHVIRSHSGLRVCDRVHVGYRIVLERNINRAVAFLPLSLSWITRIDTISFYRHHTGTQPAPNRHPTGLTPLASQAPYRRPTSAQPAPYRHPTGARPASYRRPTGTLPAPYRHRDSLEVPHFCMV